MNKAGYFRTTAFRCFIACNQMEEGRRGAADSNDRSSMHNSFFKNYMNVFIHNVQSFELL